MADDEIVALVSQINQIATYYHALPDLPLPLPMRCIVLPSLLWEPDMLEQPLELALPKDLRALWKRTSGLILFEDLLFGLWGLVIWSPDQALSRHTRYSNDWADDDRCLRPGDLLIGEFLGDLEQIVIRCDPQQLDFGSVLIAQPIDPREDWPVVANSLSGFLTRFIETNLRRFGEKYWEHYR
ncbi:MAG: SMI1/KNR4 family protein [Thermomicrobiales bacterium]